MIIHISMRLKFRKLGIGDFLTFIAFIISMGLVGQITWAVIDEGQGQHLIHRIHIQSLLINELLWALVNTFIRLAALGFLWDVFVVPSSPLHRRFQIVTMIVLSIAYGVASLLTTVLICRPIQTAWDSRVQGTCGDQTIAYVALESAGLIIDLAILILPIVIILKLNMSMKNKLVIVVISSTGGM